MATRRFEAGEFTQEEYTRLDELIGDDWVELTDDQLVGRVRKALGEVTKADNSTSSTEAFFANLMAQLKAALDNTSPPFGMHDLKQPDRTPGGPGFNSSAPPVIPNSSPASPAVRKGIGDFLDSISKTGSPAELKEALELARTGRYSPAETEAVRKAVEESKDGELIKSAAALLGGVRELMRRSGPHGGVSITLK